MPIRDMLAIMPVSDNFREVGSRLQPSVTGKEVKEALEVLESQGLIEKDGITECYRAIDRQVSITFGFSSTTGFGGGGGGFGFSSIITCARRCGTSVSAAVGFGFGRKGTTTPKTRR